MNVDADMLSRYPLDLHHKMDEHPESVSAVWQRSKSVHDSDVPWVAPLQPSHQDENTVQLDSISSDTHKNLCDAQNRAKQTTDPP